MTKIFEALCTSVLFLATIEYNDTPIVDADLNENEANSDYILND